MSQFLRLLKATFQHFWRNLWLSVITITIIFFASVAMHIFVASNSLAQATSSFLRQKIDIALYLVPSVTAPQAQKLQQTIAALPLVAEVRVSTPADVYADFLKRYEREAETMKAIRSIDSNPFGYVVRVTAKRLEDYPRLYDALSDPQVVPEGSVERKNFDDRSDALKRFTVVERSVRLGMLGVVAFFVLLSLFVVFHTIRLNIYSQRDEIGIMKLVGATNWFIRLPFILEAFVYSIVAVGLGFAVILPLVHVADPFVVTLFGSSSASLVTYYQTHLVWIVLGQLVGLSLATMISAIVAVGKYVRV